MLLKNLKDNNRIRINKIQQIEEVLRRLQLVLDAMQRSQSFQEIVNMVISIKNEEQRLKKLAEEKKRAESGLDEIFD